jgi:hypothetical protein
MRANWPAHRPGLGREGTGQEQDRTESPFGLLGPYTRLLPEDVAPVMPGANHAHPERLGQLGHPD